MKSQVSARGKITLPKEARDALGIKPGDTVKLFFDRHGGIVVLPTVELSVLRGIAKGRAVGPATLEEEEEAMMLAATERHMPEPTH